MHENIETVLAWVLATEGGFVNDPKDPGGPTNMGVTQRVYDAYRKRSGLVPRSVRIINADEVAAIYTRQYWALIRGDDLPSGVDYAVMDYAVNSGPKRAIQDLQRSLRVTPDGIIGDVTLAALVRADAETVIADLCGRRMNFLRGLRGWARFGRGWSRRVIGKFTGEQDDDVGVIDRATAMARGSDHQAIGAPVAPVDGKAIEEDRDNVGQSTTVQASALQVVSGAGAMAGALNSLSGTAQIVAMVIAGVIVLSALWIMRERLIKWADGVR